MTVGALRVFMPCTCALSNLCLLCNILELVSSELFVHLPPFPPFASVEGKGEERSSKLSVGKIN